MEPTKSRARTWLITSALVAGAALGAAGVAGAATSNDASTTANAPSALSAPQGAPQGGPQGAPQGQDPFTVEHGPGEELLTGSIADQVTAKALEAVPGATVIRVETDTHGGTYEAHLKQADGSAVTVTFNEDLSVKSTEDGFGPRPQGDHQGPPPAGAPRGDRQGPPPADAPQQGATGTQGAA